MKVSNIATASMSVPVPRYKYSDFAKYESLEKYMVSIGQKMQREEFQSLKRLVVATLNPTGELSVFGYDHDDCSELFDTQELARFLELYEKYPGSVLAIAGGRQQRSCSDCLGEPGKLRSFTEAFAYDVFEYKFVKNKYLYSGLPHVEFEKTITDVIESLIGITNERRHFEIVLDRKEKTLSQTQVYPQWLLHAAEAIIRKRRGLPKRKMH